MVRYPHSITVSWQGDPVRDDATGNYTAGALVTHTIECSISQNSNGSKIGIDGQMIDYSSIALMELQNWTAPNGANAVVTFEDGTVINDTVKRMMNRQTHSKIWL